MICGVICFLAIAGGGIGFFLHWRSNKHLAICRENMTRYAAALKCYQDANGRNPWEMAQLDKYLGARPLCPANKKGDSYVLSEGVEGEILLEGIAESIPVLLCVHGNRALVLYEDGNIRMVKGTKKIQAELKPSQQQFADREAYYGGAIR